MATQKKCGIMHNKKRKRNDIVKGEKLQPYAVFTETHEVKGS